MSYFHKSKESYTKYFFRGPKDGEIIYNVQERKEPGSLDPPNSLDFGKYLYSLPFFDFLLERQIEIPEQDL